ncbi:MAG: T9SS type A sorting domain-containing protein [Bacteroidia bacterium]
MFLILFGNKIFSQTPTFQALLQNTRGTELNEILKVAVDNNGNTFFCGRHSDTLQLGSFTLLPGQGGAYWGKADATGNILWLKQGGTSQASGDYASGITVDQNGDVYVCGAITGNLIASFNGIPLSIMYQGFVLKYSNSGNFIWASGIGSRVFSIAIDNNNTPVINKGDQEVYRLNATTGAEILTPSAFIQGNLVNSGFHNIVVDGGNNIIVQAGNKIIKYDNNFNQLWSTPVTSSIFETYLINLDQNGNVYGSFYALFGTVTVGTVVKSNFPNGYIYKLDGSTGAPMFVDSVFIAGAVSKIKEVVPKNGNYYLSGDGAFNTAHVLKVTPTYTVLWDKTLSDKARPNNIQIISEDCLFMGGSHTATVTLDAYTLTPPNGTININNSFFTFLCNGSVGILEANESVTEIQIFPNPAQNEINLSGSGKFESVMIMDIAGKIIEANVSNNIIDVSKLESGIYFILVSKGKEYIYRKFVKN